MLGGLGAIMFVIVEIKIVLHDEIRDSPHIAPVVRGGSVARSGQDIPEILPMQPVVRGLGDANKKVITTVSSPVGGEQVFAMHKADQRAIGGLINIVDPAPRWVGVVITMIVPDKGR